MRPEPRAHQVQGVDWIQRVRRGLLADEPGLGKTRIALDATAGAGRVLVVAPNLVLSSGTWDEEIARWSDSPQVYTQAPYSRLNARVATGRGGSRPVPRLRDEFKGRWDAVIVDEAHYTKGRKTSWTWAVQQIAKDADLVLEMTGTPIPNWAHELFTVLQVIYPDQAGRGQRYGSFWRWAGQWFDTSPTRFSNGNPVVGEMRGCLEASPGGRVCLERPAWDPCEHYQRFARENLGDRYLRRLRDQVLDLPAVTQRVVQVEMGPAQRAAYNSMKRDFVATVDGKQVVSWSQGAKNVALDKITVSDWLLNPVGPPRGGKFEMLRFDLESRSRPTLVLAHHRDVVEACAAVSESLGASTRYIHGGVPSSEAGKAVRAFKAGKVDVLVGSLETLSEGLTLVQADMAIFVEKSFKPSRNEQAMRRIHRLGQQRPVTIVDYVTPRSVDERKRRLLETKTDRAMRVLTGAEFAALL